MPYTYVLKTYIFLLNIIWPNTLVSSVLSILFYYPPASKKYCGHIYEFFPFILSCRLDDSNT